MIAGLPTSPHMQTAQLQSGLAFGAAGREFLMPGIFRTGMANLGGAMKDDDELMAEINAYADSAFRALPANQNIGEIAKELAAKYKHRDTQDIAEQLRIVWRARNMFYD